MRRVLAALVPGCVGRIPAFFPAPVRVVLWLSAAVAGACALAWQGRPFFALTPEAREAVLDRMAHHPSPHLRNLVAWWKLVALVDG